MSKPPRYTSAGSLIIDDIKFANGEIAEGVLGGGGIHAIYGARIWLSPSDSTQLGYVANLGDDCPTDVIDRLNELDIRMHIRQIPGEKQPRAWNIFGVKEDPDHRAFEWETSEGSYTKNFRILPTHLPPSWLSSLTHIHLITSPSRLITWVEQYKSLGQTPFPYLIWEPSPTSCKPENWSEFLRACGYVNLVSPNHEEAYQLASGVLNDSTDTNGSISWNNISSLPSLHHLAKTIQNSLSISLPPTILLRASHNGCLITPPSGKSIHIPAYWTNSLKIKDTTGAGNSFLGGYMVGHGVTGDPVLAACYGTVSASFTVERVGTCDVKNGEVEREERLRRLREIVGV